MTESRAIRQVRYGEGREALLDATVRVVASGGLRNLTYRAVAEQAGVTHGLVRHHFGTRDALLEEAMRFVVERSMTTTRLEPGTGSIDDFASQLVDTVAGDTESQAFQYELILESRRRPELLRFTAELYEAYREAVRRELVLMGLGHIAGLHIAVFAALEGMVFHEVALRDTESMRQGVQALRVLLQHAVSAAAAGDGAD